MNVQTSNPANVHAFIVKPAARQKRNLLITGVGLHVRLFLPAQFCNLICKSIQYGLRAYQIGVVAGLFPFPHSPFSSFVIITQGSVVIELSITSDKNSRKAHLLKGVAVMFDLATTLDGHFFRAGLSSMNRTTILAKKQSRQLGQPGISICFGKRAHTTYGLTLLSAQIHSDICSSAHASEPQQRKCRHH